MTSGSDNAARQSFRAAVRAYRKEIGLGVILGLLAWGLLVVGATLAVPPAEDQPVHAAHSDGTSRSEHEKASQQRLVAVAEPPAIREPSDLQDTAAATSGHDVEKDAKPASGEPPVSRDVASASNDNTSDSKPSTPTPPSEPPAAPPPSRTPPSAPVVPSVALVPEKPWFAGATSDERDVADGDSANPDKSADPTVAQVERAMATARIRQLPILFLLHAQRGNEDPLYAWQVEINRRDKPQFAKLKELAEAYVVITWPLKDAEALAVHLHLRPFALHGRDAPQFVVTRCNGRQLSVVSSWNRTDLLIYSLAQGVVQEAKERTRSPEQLKAVLELVAPIDEGLASQVKRLLRLESEK